MNYRLLFVALSAVSVSAFGMEKKVSESKPNDLAETTTYDGKGRLCWRCEEIYVPTHGNPEEGVYLLTISDTRLKELAKNSTVPSSIAKAAALQLEIKKTKQDKKEFYPQL